MIKRLVVLSALAIGSVLAAHADSINGSFAINGNDGFDTSHLTFGTASVGGIPTGTFVGMTGAVLMLPNFPLDTALPYANGFQTVLQRTGFASIEVMTNTTGSIVTDFFMTDYTATVDTTGQHSCGLLALCLTITGDGFFTETGYTNSPGSFTFTTQESTDELGMYETGKLAVTPTTFSATGTAAPTPEPSSLLLLGTGIFGLAGLARHKLLKA